MKRLFAGSFVALVVALTGVPDAAAQNPLVEAVRATQTIPPGMTRKDIPSGFAVFGRVKQTVEELKSEGGKYVILSSRRVVRVVDTAENIKAMTAFMARLGEKPVNVKIEVTAMSISGNNLRGGTIDIAPRVNSGGRVFGGTNQPFRQNGTTTPGIIRQNTADGRPIGRPIQTNNGNIIMPRGGVDVGITQQRNTSSSLNKSFILIQSGGTGTLEVVREVPLVDFFTQFTAGNQGPPLIRGPGNFNQQIFLGGEFKVPEFRWEKAGTQLLVRPTVQGDLITIEVIPQVSAIVIVDPQKVQNRAINSHLTEADQYVSYTRLKTTVTVKSGATITIGSFSNASSEFNSAFFGTTGGSAFTSTGGSGGSMTLRATIQ